MNYRKVFSITFILGMIPFIGVSKALAEKKTNKADRPEIILCYKPAPIKTIESDLHNQKKEIYKQLINLDKSYKQGKISEKTYTLRKKSLEEKFEALNKEIKDN